MDAPSFSKTNIGSGRAATAGNGRGSRLSRWSATAVLAVAVFATVMFAILRHISIIGLGKAFGPVSAGQTIIVYGLYAIAALVTVLSVPVTLFLGIAMLFTSGKRSRSAFFCAVVTCLLSSADLLFWRFYCGGMPGTAQRPFP